MVRIEQCDPGKERVCESCEEVCSCPYLGTSPVVFQEGGEVKCLIIDRRDTSNSMLIPVEFRITKGGRVEGYEVKVVRFRQGRFWRWLRGWMS